MKMKGGVREGTSLETPIILADNATGEELIQLTIKICHAINARNWDHPSFQFLNDRMHSAHENVDNDRVMSRQDHIDAHRRIAERTPGYHLGIRRVEAHVNDNETTADVWMDLIISGIGEEGRFSKESVSILRARKVKGVWSCWKQDGLRGVFGGA